MAPAPRSPAAALGQTISASAATGAGPPRRSTSGTRASVLPAAGRCRGVLEWTLRSSAGPAGEDAASPRWAGPCMFQIDELADGRQAFRVTKPFRPDGKEGEAMSIPLLAISAVREDKQDVLGLAFAVRYKVAGERVEVLFRAATRDGRSAWVSGLCEAVRESRSHGAEQRPTRRDKERARMETEWW
eukprot:TRINITY_DN5256_c0_g1_i2.p1 TRINITY_DN5256_c0_g1~~TRINITY_DN5256_c0_g1_i2.p1  ORF type:complete len:219 (+),score=42.41 TRINITY_DN5256_c0_g1_i2:97-657(+)